MEQPDEITTHKRMGNQDAALIREIYELTHEISASNDQSKRARLVALKIEAERRNLL